MVSSISISIARGSCVMGSRPLHFGRHRRQDRIAFHPGLEPGEGAAVVEQGEFDVAAAADQLLLAVLSGPWRAEIAPDQFGIDLCEGAADALRKGEVGVPVAGVEPVVKDAADAARFLAMRQ